MSEAEKKEKKHHHKTSSKEHGSKLDKKSSVKKSTDKKEKKSSKSQSNSMAALPDVPLTNGSAPPVASVPGADTASVKPSNSTAVLASRSAADAADSAANAKLDVCAGCGKNIMGDISHAMNKKWHIYCFVCTTCSAPVSDEYYETDGRPYCRKDFNKSFGASCAGCKKQLQGKKLKALDKEWHPACFLCRNCKKPFPEMEYYDIDGNPYCLPCYDKEEEKLSKP